MRLLATVLLMLAGCSGDTPEAADVDAAGALERAAVERGLVADPDALPLTGLFARDASRICLSGDGDRGVIGVSIDYGEGNGCSASGAVERRGATLAVDLGEPCRFDATHDGESMRFPGVVPEGCGSLCQGNASLAGLSVERLSHSPGEVAAFRDRRGRFPCAAAIG